LPEASLEPAQHLALNSRFVLPEFEIELVPEKLLQIQSNLAAVQDHARQFADFTFVYPVISRRSRGLSLGINLNPDKVCNFDCVYCEVDRHIPGKVSRVDLSQMRDELIAMIRFAKDGGLAKEPKFNEVPWLAREVKDLAFSGDGEPTLIHNFAECVQIVAAVKQGEHLTRTKIVLITDAAGLDKADIRRGLEIMDAENGEVWGKLDAGTETYFRTVNRTSIRFDRILRNLLETARDRPIVIQSLFLKLHGQGPPPDELAAYCHRLKEMIAQGGQIKEVHAYTVARPTPEPCVSKLDAQELHRLAQVIRQETGLRVFAFE
jgi:wyosine [tRNA(Phe)-imidazoG37] synthetase (radical SAM superfamily)